MTVNAERIGVDGAEHRPASPGSAYRLPPGAATTGTPTTTGNHTDGRASGLLRGRGHAAATVAVLVLSIIVFMANIYCPMVVLIEYSRVLLDHDVPLRGDDRGPRGDVGLRLPVLRRGGFPLRRLGRALAAYVVLCGVVCFVAVLAAKDGAIEDNCAESRE